MPEIKVLNMAGAEVGKMDLSDKVFGAEAVSYTHLDVYKRQPERSRNA